jgi:hypothetical protein
MSPYLLLCWPDTYSLIQLRAVLLVSRSGAQQLDVRTNDEVHINTLASFYDGLLAISNEGNMPCSLDGGESRFRLSVTPSDSHITLAGEIGIPYLCDTVRQMNHSGDQQTSGSCAFAFAVSRSYVAMATSDLRKLIDHLTELSGEGKVG